MSRHSKDSKITVALGLVTLLIVAWGTLQRYDADSRAKAPEAQTPVPTNLKDAPASLALNSSTDHTGSIMRAIVSIVILGAACVVLLRRHESSAHQRWATGMVTLIAGYWLK